MPNKMWSGRVESTIDLATMDGLGWLLTPRASVKGPRSWIGLPGDFLDPMQSLFAGRKESDNPGTGTDQSSNMGPHTVTHPISLHRRQQCHLLSFRIGELIKEPELTRCRCGKLCTTDSSMLLGASDLHPVDAMRRIERYPKLKSPAALGSWQRRQCHLHFSR